MQHNNSQEQTNASSVRRRVRRLSQLEPVHIAALKQEYITQIREASQAEANSQSQRDHYEKAKKIKILLEKHEAQENQRLQSQLAEQASESASLPSSRNQSLPETPVAEEGLLSQSTGSSSIPQQVVDPSLQESHSQKSAPLMGTFSSASNYANDGQKLANQQQPKPLSVQLQRLKQMEKEANDQLEKVQSAIAENPDMNQEARLKLRQQEQNLRTKRDQFKGMVLTVTQQLQVQQQKLDSQRQGVDSELVSGKASTYNTQTTTTSFQAYSPAPPLDSQRTQSKSFQQNSDSSNYGQSFSKTIPSQSFSQSGHSFYSPDSPAYSNVQEPANSQTDQFKHFPHTLSKASTFPGKSVRIPGKVGRPPLASTLAARGIAQTVSPPVQPAFVPEKVFNKRKISELIKNLMPDEVDEIVVENEVEELVGDLVEEFVDNVAMFASRLAKHRKSTHIEAKDVHVHLERNWNLRVAGFPGDEVSIVRKAVPSKSYLAKLDMVNASKFSSGSGRY